MEMTEKTVTVEADGRINLAVPYPVGTRVKVVVSEASCSNENQDLSTGSPATTGFANKVLANPKEDVWNDL